MALTSTTMDAIVARVNCYGVGAWLDGLLQDLGLALPALMASLPVTLPRSTGLSLKIDLRRPVPSGDPHDAVFVALAEGDDTVSSPLGLDRTNETIETARAKLSPSTVGGSAAELAAGDRRVSFFMDGGRVIELRFKPGLVGFDRIVIARLGAPQDWRNPSSH